MIIDKKMILTLQVEILDKEKAAWIWVNHLGVDTDNGVYVKIIKTGPIIEEREEKT
jgi:hypothetical protein